MKSFTKTKSTQLKLSSKRLDHLIQFALNEDIGSGDVTTESIVPENQVSTAYWSAKQDGVVAGLFIGERVFRSLDKNIRWHSLVKEGDTVKAGDVLAQIGGRARALLTGERTALNFVQHLSGIATNTNKFVKRIEGTKTKILDTRKTVPGFRALDKYAVRVGGGENHRIGLHDMALIKENHTVIAHSITRAVERARSNAPEVKIEVEAASLIQVKEALKAGADMILLDNMSNVEMKKSVNWIDGRVKTEASGNISLERLEEVAATGVDFISIGALTHSVEAFDISQILA